VVTSVLHLSEGDVDSIGSTPHSLWCCLFKPELNLSEVIVELAGNGSGFQWLVTA
jgi:hypothetical protein